MPRTRTSPATESYAARSVRLLVRFGGPVWLLGLTFVPALRSQEAAPPDTGVVVVAVGDIVCGSRTPQGLPCLHTHTANLVRQLAPAALLLLGDLQYETGSPDDFRDWFDPAFGSLRDVMRPAPGNHEYMTRGARGYYDYFNGVKVDSGRAGNRERGYYSFDVGTWHLVALNSNCDDIRGGCGPRSDQARWLRDDLTRHPAACTIAYWHHARFSSGAHGDDDSMRDIWPILQEFGVEFVLQGHDHDYERLGPLDARGRPDTARGVRSFVVGTGGKGLGRFGRPRPGSEIESNEAIGVLRLVLGAGRYEWSFVPIDGQPVIDSGAGTCRAAPGR